MQLIIEMVCSMAYWDQVEENCCLPGHPSYFVSMDVANLPPIWRSPVFERCLDYSTRDRPGKTAKAQNCPRDTKFINGFRWLRQSHSPQRLEMKRGACEETALATRQMEQGVVLPYDA